MFKILQTKSLPLFQFSWIKLDVTLKMTKFRTNFRQISYICKKFSEANNEDMKNSDPTKRSKYITYLNENKLYEWVMSRYLLYGGFKWLKDVDSFNVNFNQRK